MYAANHLKWLMLNVVGIVCKFLSNYYLWYNERASLYTLRMQFELLSICCWLDPWIENPQILTSTLKKVSDISTAKCTASISVVLWSTVQVNKQGFPLFALPPLRSFVLYIFLMSAF